MRRLLVGGALIGAIACTSSEFFVCNDDTDCVGAGEGGVCQPIGACSVPDDVCPSGQRYVEGSQPSIAGECVADGSATGGMESTTGTDPTADDADETGPVGGCPPDWWDCAWRYRQRLELAEPVDEVLVDAPVLLWLTAGRVDHERMQADGEDVRVVSAAGTVAPYEVERWDPEGVSMIWASVDVLGGGADHLWVYYGNPVAESEEDPGAVWAEPFAAVWHLEDEPLDATDNANDAVAAGNTEVSLGQIGNGRNWRENNGRLEVMPSESLADVFTGGGTVSAWFRARYWGASGFGRIFEKSGPELGGWLFYVVDGGQLRFGLALGMDSPNWGTPMETLSLQRWTHVAVTYDTQGETIPRMFVDGIEVPLESPMAQPELVDLPSDAEIGLVIGNRPDLTRRFGGVLDEVRIERATRSPAWIRVQARSMRDELLLFGSIEENPEVAP